MHAFVSLAYLDVEKSGSTFVSGFLRDFLDDEEVGFGKHEPLEDSPPAGRLHVLSVRDPFDTYLSLYSYGCQGRGVLGRSLRREGFGVLYDGTAEGFRRWLDVVLDPAHAALMRPLGYHRSGVAEHVGLLSFRVARLSAPRPLEWLSQVGSADELVAAYRSRSVVDEVLRNESLVADLERLVRRPDLRWRPTREAALEALGGLARVNASERVDRGPGFTVPPGAWEAVAEREVLLTEVFGYDGARWSGEAHRGLRSRV
ncbi:hypothetical protein [Isoptericola cucumis]|uniref:Sulfotransferase family protein n=1 Tax=Isoptericola cucumis TaxID=1776856 RepID=A0ABQ2B852_9MICO|nr:hypothetical protein [Isoptericola cucumis]GGI08662.1 hypothetical protein GCM10007368_22280 [Isoptericola cucumis]